MFRSAFMRRIFLSSRAENYYFTRGAPGSARLSDKSVSKVRNHPKMTKYDVIRCRQDAESFYEVT